MRINPQIVEPIIALSIVYIGLENIFKKYIKEYLRYVVILFFGLLHGLGFALVLSDIGFRGSELFLNLISFNIGNHHPSDIGSILDQYGIAVRTGQHCTQPIMDHFNIPGTVRASFSFYNTKSEIDLFIDAIEKASKMLG